MATIEDYALELHSEQPRDHMIILRTPTSHATISNRACSIEDLGFLIDGEWQHMVFGHHHWYNVQNPTHSLPFSDEYDAEVHTFIAQSRNSNLMMGGVPVTFFPGRLVEGKMWFLQPDGRYEKFEVPISHPQFNSLLHLGEGKDEYFDIVDKTNNENSASVTFQGIVGGKVYDVGFPQGIVAQVKYTLTETELVREVSIQNKSGIYVTVPTSDHGSYFPRNRQLGNSKISDMWLCMLANEQFQLDPNTKAATGIVNSQEYRTEAETRINPVEAFYAIRESGIDYSIFELTNEKENAGLKITTYPPVDAAYVWTHNIANERLAHQFVSLQPYFGGATAAVNLPALLDAEKLAQVHPIFRQGPNTWIEPGQIKIYTTRFSGFKG